MGPAAGEPIAFDWKWHYSLPTMALWVVLALAIALPKANRTPHIILILVPILAVRLLWSVLVQIVPGDDAVVGDMLTQALGTSIALWWLTGHLFAERPWTARVVYALAISLAIVLIGGAGYGLRVDPQTITAGGMFFCMVCAVLAAFILTVRQLRGYWSPGRLLGFLALWTAVTVQIGTLWVYITTMALMGALASLLQTLPFLIVTGLIAGAFIYVVNLPFVLLGVYHPFYRQRMTALLSLPAGPQGSGYSVPSET